MIKNVKSYRKDSLLSEELFRQFTETFESETLRGITTLCILKIIMDHGDQGTYGYDLIKILKEQSNNLLTIEEGRLYPLLKNLEKWGKDGQEIQVIRSEKRRIENRVRKYYIITEKGRRLYYFWKGLFTNILSSISTILNLNESHIQKKVNLCPNCHNIFEIDNEEMNFCEICGCKLQK